MAGSSVCWRKTLKGYIVTLLNLPESVSMAERCIESAKQFNVDVEIFPGVWKDISINEMNNENLKLDEWDNSFSNTNAVVGNFISQFRIWKRIVESGEPGIVLEHDAVFVDYVPDLSDGDIINLGKPSYGQFFTKTSSGIFPMFSKQNKHIPGAHGYYLTPHGANDLIQVAKDKGVAPCDIFLNKSNFPNIKEIYPWVIEARDEFTTIQKEKGCGAKHNYNKKFKIL